LTSTSSSAGGRDLHQLGLVEGLVTGRGSAAAIASTNKPRGVAGGGLDRHQLGLVVEGLDQGVDLDQLVRRRPGFGSGRYLKQVVKQVGRVERRGLPVDPLRTDL